MDGFSKKELEEINKKIDHILEKLERIDMGNEVIFDEIESFRNDAKKLSKKDFKSMVIGKFVSMGIDSILPREQLSEIFNLLINDDFGKYLK